MDWVMISAAVFAVWVATSLVGYERQRRVQAVTAATTPPADEAGNAHH